jgi:hypothetical protein
MTSIYHITHIDNLLNILKEGGLWCDSESARRKLEPVEIAYTRIKERRTRKLVPVPPGGVLAEYIPFYFCNRSPMLYVIHHGYVPVYRDGQKNILHLVSSVEAAARSQTPFVFTDGHAVVDISRYFTDLGDLEQIDWPVIEAWSWHNTTNDNDRERRKQAEFLAHNFFPWKLIQEIGVINLAVRDMVLSLLEKAEHKPVVSIRRKWYYD